MVVEVTKTVTAAEFVAKAREAIGTPWHHQGRVVPIGVDCVGLLLWTLRQLDINHYEPPPYPRTALWGQFIGYFRNHLIEVPITDLRPGDVLIFRQSVYPCHCGILTEAGADPKFIHSYLTRKKVVEERLTMQWKPVLVTAFRVPGVV